MYTLTEYSTLLMLSLKSTYFLRLIWKIYTNASISMVKNLLYLWENDNSLVWRKIPGTAKPLKFSCLLSHKNYFSVIVIFCNQVTQICLIKS